MTHDEYQKEIDEMQDLITDSLGEAGALEAVCKALSYDQKKEVFEYIIRCWDLQGEEENE